MRVAILIILCILLLGCSGTKTITITEVDTVIVHDTIQLVEIDSIWHGGIYNDKDSIGSVAVNPKSKTAIVKIRWLKPDTVYFEVPTTYPVIFDNFLNRVIETFFKVMPFWQKLILIVMVIGIIYIIYLIKGNARKK